MTIDKILYEIDEATLPEKMSKDEAVEFLEQLSLEIECRINGLKDEIEELK